MRVETMVRVLAFALVIAGTSILAAPEQTAQPGQMTQARVWIQNHGRNEAVPVELRDVNLEAPLKVQVINGDSGFARASSVLVTETRKLWDYQSLTVAPTENLAAIMSVQGANGWETTGIWSVNPDQSTTLLLKRPR